MPMTPQPSRANARSRIAALIKGRTSRPTSLTEAIDSLVSSWGLSSFDAATFGFLSSVNTDADCSISATSNVLTSTSAPWSAADVGKTIHVQGAGFSGGTLSAIVAGFVNSGQITLSLAASTAVSASSSSVAGIAAWGFPSPVRVPSSPLTTPDGGFFLEPTDQDATVTDPAFRSEIVRTAQVPGGAFLARLWQSIFSYNEAAPVPIKIVGMGSSVGVGATLPDPANQAPVAYFASSLRAKLDPANIYTWAVHNGSVNGSTIFDGDTTNWPTIDAAHDPAVVLLIYGMNDGATAIFNSGQTFNGAYTSLRSLCMKIMAAGATPVIVTSPHPHSGRISWSMPGGVPQNYPSSVAAPVADSALIPPVSQSIKSADPLGRGRNINVAHRFIRINEMMRRVASEMGLPLVDAEKYWFEALYEHAEDELFNAGEFNHPNLLGHQLSYWKAIDDFTTAAASYGSGGPAFSPSGQNGFNVLTPTAAVHARPYATGQPAFAADTVAGINLIKANDDKSVDVAPRSDTPFRHGPAESIPYALETYGGAAGFFASRRYSAVFNANSLAIPGITAGGGTLVIYATQGGIGHQAWAAEYVCTGSAITIGTPRTVGPVVISSVTASGTTITINAAAANTNIKYSLLTL